MMVVGSVLLVLGGVLALIAAVGLQRFDDVFARMHSATKPATLGLILVLGGAALLVASPGAVAKLTLVVLLQFITAPVAAHLVGRASFRAGSELSRETTVDDRSREFLDKPIDTEG